MTKMRSEVSTNDRRRDPGGDRKQPAMVSVIVPVLDAAPFIEECVRALLNQTYDRECYEIIVVDNGSTDRTRDVVRPYPVLLLEETTWRSPYAARNAGISRARGEVLAFTDADCTPEPTWLERGVEALEDDGVDLVGGKVNFTFSRPATLGELVDALWHLDVKRQIEINRACMTANLLVWTEVFGVVGAFDSRVRSGGDGRWTRRATDAGFRLVYAPEAVINKPTRRLGPVLAKAYRVGRGLPRVWLERGTSRQGVAKGVMWNLLPPRLPAVRQRIVERIPAGIKTHTLALWWMSWLLELVRTAGCVRGWFELRTQRPSLRPRNHHE